MATTDVEREYHVSQIIIIYKYVSGIIEIILGLGIVFWGNEIVRLYERFKVRELLEDPRDTLVRAVETVLPFVLKHRQYLIIFLLVLGITKVVGAVGLTFRKAWALDLLVILGAFLLPFDLVDFLRHPTPLSGLYVLINLFIVLYLMDFHPRDYAARLKSRVGLKK